MTPTEKMELFVRHTAELRGELVDSGDEVTAMVYALCSCYIGEAVAQELGWERITDLLGEAATTLLVNSERSNLDGFIDEILSGSLEGDPPDEVLGGSNG